MFTQYLQDRYSKLFKIYVKLNIYIFYHEYNYSIVKNRENYYFNDIYYNLQNSNGLDEYIIIIKYLKLASWFNQLIELPINLIKLDLGHNFNQSIDCISKLTNLRELKLSAIFNQTIDQLPVTLIKLNL